MFEGILTPLSIPSPQYYIFKVNNTVIEILEKGAKYIQRLEKRHQKHANSVVLVSLLLPLNIFHTFF